METVGEGPDVVLVHGAFGWGRQTFAEQYVLAEHGYRLHVVDRRGYGASRARGGVGWPVDEATLIAAFVDSTKYTVSAIISRRKAS